MADTATNEAPLTLPEFAKQTGMTVRKAQRLAERGDIPTWSDPLLRGKVTSMAAFAKARAMKAAKAMVEYEQRAAKVKRRNG